MTREELKSWLKPECSFLTNGHCETAGCYRRAGYSRGEGKPPISDYTPTCEAKELDAMLNAARPVAQTPQEARCSECGHLSHGRKGMCWVAVGIDDEGNDSMCRCAGGERQPPATAPSGATAALVAGLKKAERFLKHEPQCRQMAEAGWLCSCEVETARKALRDAAAVLSAPPAEWQFPRQEVVPTGTVIQEWISTGVRPEDWQEGFVDPSAAAAAIAAKLRTYATVAQTPQEPLAKYALALSRIFLSDTDDVSDITAIEIAEKVRDLATAQQHPPSQSGATTEAPEELDTYTPVLWVTLNDDGKYAEYLRVKTLAMRLQATPPSGATAALVARLSRRIADWTQERADCERELVEARQRYRDSQFSDEPCAECRTKLLEEQLLQHAIDALSAPPAEAWQPEMWALVEAFRANAEKLRKQAAKLRRRGDLSIIGGPSDDENKAGADQLSDSALTWEDAADRLADRLNARLPPASQERA